MMNECASFFVVVAQQILYHLSFSSLCVLGVKTTKSALFFTRAAMVRKLQDEVSQPGNIPHRPALFGIHIKPEHVQVMHGLMEVRTHYYIDLVVVLC